MGSLAFGALVRRYWPQALVLIGVAALLVSVLWIKGQRDDARDERDKAQAELTQAKADLALARTDAAAKERASVERQADGVKVAAQTKELTDAIKTVPDTQPDAVRVALGCQRLRAAGRTADADLPAVCRSGDGAQARPTP